MAKKALKSLGRKRQTFAAKPRRKILKVSRQTSAPVSSLSPLNDDIPELDPLFEVGASKDPEEE